MKDSLLNFNPQSFISQSLLVHRSIAGARFGASVSPRPFYVLMFISFSCPKMASRFWNPSLNHVCQFCFRIQMGWKWKRPNSIRFTFGICHKLPQNRFTIRSWSSFQASWSSKPHAIFLIINRRWGWAIIRRLMQWNMIQWNMIPCHRNISIENHNQLLMSKYWVLLIHLSLSNDEDFQDSVRRWI